jgi:hypothetical protein
MPKFLIEIPHERETIACARAVQVLLTTGSHFVSHAEFGCKDDDHRVWMMVDVENRQEAERIVPPVFRSQAHIVQLNRFTLEELAGYLEHHQG